MAHGFTLRGRDEATKRLVEWATAKGWVVTQTKGEHLKFTHPRAGVSFHSKTGSDYRGWLNARAQIRRKMLAAGYTREEVE